MKNLFRLNTPPNRVFGLDLMRAMAILFVMISHAELQLPESLKAVNRLFYFDGVLIFFVLSGFLIGNIFIRQLEENGQERRGKEYIQRIEIRWNKIQPSLQLLLRACGKINLPLITYHLSLTTSLLLLPRCS